MPITPPGFTTSLLQGLVGAGMLGPATPKFAAALGTGLVQWTATIRVTTIDTGTAGVGAGVLPLVIPQPVFQTALQGGFVAAGILGPLSPAMVTGLATGLFGCYAQGLIMTLHPVVGVGACVARFNAPPALPVLQAALAGQGLLGVGGTKIATALSIALAGVFGVLSIPVPIAGPPSTVPSAGSGTGSIV